LAGPTFWCEVNIGLDTSEYVAYVVQRSANVFFLENRYRETRNKWLHTSARKPRKWHASHANDTAISRGPPRHSSYLYLLHMRTAHPRCRYSASHHSHVVPASVMWTTPASHNITRTSNFSKCFIVTNVSLYLPVRPSRGLRRSGIYLPFSKY
jgi:hypothetical protein